MEELFICPQPNCKHRFTLQSSDRVIVCRKCKYSGDRSTFKTVLVKIRTCNYCGHKWPDHLYSTTDRSPIICERCHHVYTPTIITQRRHNTKWESPGIIILHEDHDNNWIDCEVSSFMLNEGSNIIGRKSNNEIDISLPTNDNFMSRSHVEIIAKKNPDKSYTLTIKDLSTHNATYISDSKLPKEQIAIIEPGTKIKLGHTTFAICDITSKSHNSNANEPNTLPV